jgi:hypothetical protein
MKSGHRSSSTKCLNQSKLSTLLPLAGIILGTASGIITAYSSEVKLFVKRFYNFGKTQM